MKYDKPKIVLYNLKAYNEINTKGNDSFVVNEIKSLEKTIKDNGFEIVPCSYRWPRDLFVEDDMLIPRYKFNELGEGGLIVQGKDFVLISSKVKKKLDDLKDFEEHEQINYDYNNKEHNSKILEDYKKLVKNRGIKFYLNEDHGIKFKNWLNNEEVNLFNGKKIYFIEPNKECSNDHIDLTIGSVPSLDIITVDEDDYYNNIEIFKEINSLVFPVPVTDKKRCQNNYLVVDGDRPFVVTDPNAEALNYILGSFNINLQSVDNSMIANSEMYGSIRCLTNIVSDKETENLIKEMEQIYDKASLIQFTTGKKTPSIEALMYLLNKKSKNKL